MGPGQGNPDTLELIRDTLTTQRAQLEQLADSYDTRAGLILAFAGVLVGLVDDDAVLAHVALGFACVAAALALWTLWLRKVKYFKGPELLAKYGGGSLEVAAKAIADTSAEHDRMLRKLIRKKAIRLKGAAAALFVAVALAGLASILANSDTTTTGGSDARTERPAD